MMKGAKSKNSSGTGKVRASISFPADHYTQIEEIAHEKKVSVAWIVRDAVEQYLTDRWPLLEAPSEKRDKS